MWYVIHGKYDCIQSEGWERSPNNSSKKNNNNNKKTAFIPERTVAIPVLHAGHLSLILNLHSLLIYVSISQYLDPWKTDIIIGKIYKNKNKTKQK